MAFDIDAVAERLAGIISDKQDKAGCALACSTLEVVIAEALKEIKPVAAAEDVLAALKRMDALVESLWKAVPWGETFNLDIQALNEAPIAAKRAIAKAEGR